MIAKDGEGEDGEETRERERGEDGEKRREKTWERSEASECEGRANRHKHVTRLVRVQTSKSGNHVAVTTTHGSLATVANTL